MAVVAEETRERLAELMVLLRPALGEGMRLDIVDPRVLEGAPKNARFMTNEQFAALVANIKRDGALGSVPLCWEREPGKIRVLSGNHRVKGAIVAELEWILVLVIEGELTRDRELSIQLSHNAISGQDDQEVLRALWAEIGEISEKAYSGLDDAVMATLEQPNLPALAEVRLDFRSTTFLFLSEEVGELEAKFRSAMGTVGDRDVFVARFAEWDRLMTALSKKMDSFNVRNVATALMLLMDLFERHEDELREGWEIPGDDEATMHGEFVPISSVLGTDRIPAKLARQLMNKVEGLLAQKKIEKGQRFKVLEVLLDKRVAPHEAG